MRFPWRRSTPAPAPPDAERGPGPYHTRYDVARQGYERQVERLARALDQATLKVYLSAAANVVLALGIVTIALRGGVHPVFVPYDRLGGIIRTEELSRFRDPPRAMVEAELARWLVNVRGVYYGDPVAQLDRGRAAQALLAPEAEQWLSAYFAVPGRSPAHLQRDLARTVEVTSITKDLERPLWHLQWRELEVPVRGSAVEAAWAATLRVEFAPLATEETVWTNPTGIRIRSIEWHRLRSAAVPPDPARAGP